MALSKSYDVWLRLGFGTNNIVRGITGFDFIDHFVGLPVTSEGKVAIAFMAGINVSLLLVSAAYFGCRKR
jgi:hypothetical protein